MKITRKRSRRHLLCTASPRLWAGPVSSPPSHSLSPPLTVVPASLTKHMRRKAFTVIITVFFLPLFLTEKMAYLTGHSMTGYTHR